MTDRPAPKEADPRSGFILQTDLLPRPPAVVEESARRGALSAGQPSAPMLAAVMEAIFEQAGGAVVTFETRRLFVRESMAKDGALVTARWGEHTFAFRVGAGPVDAEDIAIVVRAALLEQMEEGPTELTTRVDDEQLDLWPVDTFVTAVCSAGAECEDGAGVEGHTHEYDLIDLDQKSLEAWLDREGRAVERRILLRAFRFADPVVAKVTP